MSIKRPKTLADMVTNRLRQAIVDGELPFGMMLSEDALAASFEVSRTPVREALSQLQLQGLIVIFPQKGSFVFTPDEQDIEEVCEYRFMLETRAAALSVQRSPEPMIREVERAVQAMETAFAERSPRAYGRADWNFHAALFRECGNRYLRDAYSLASGKFAALSTNVSRPFPDERVVSFREHKAMLEHLRRNDLGAFETVLADHIGRTRHVYLKALERNVLNKPSGTEASALNLSGD
jgi:DNA-binding GntR family transcriptional regulator